MSRWKIWIDTGGTFTDCIAIDPNKNFKRLKILSSSVLRGNITKQINSNSFQVQMHWPIGVDIFNGFEFRVIGEEKIRRKIKSIDLINSIIHVDKLIHEKIIGCTIEITSNEEVPLLAARLLTQTQLGKDFPKIEMRLGSTRGTNALLERKGARTAFVTTKGFKDLLLIGTQQRKDLFALNVQKETPLYAFVIEVNERIESDGSIVKPLTENELKAIINKLKGQKVDSIAIAFLHSYKNPTHELLLEKALLKSGFSFISTSHRLSNQIKIVPRAETTVVNAYLSPIIKTYLNNIQNGLKSDLKIMTSAGGLSDATTFYPKDSLLSGPAGGVVGAATAAKLSGMDKLITFDMGGTSTDVSLYDQRYDYRYESKVGETKILSPSLAIETIAAGGGSICDYDGYRLTVGPHSAGASPGPACYGAGGPLTITDVNLLLGRLDPEFFALPIHPAKAEEAFDILLSKIKNTTKKKPKAERILESLAQIANEKMAEAIKKVSVQNGNNPTDYTLLSFGGAGGQHACALAEMLGMKKILVPYDAGLLSAYGIGHAKIERFEEKLILKSLNQTEPLFSQLFEQLAKEGSKKLVNDGYTIDELRKEKQLVFLRFKGQESTIEIEYDSKIKTQDSFRKKYESIFGHWIDNREIEVESVKVMLSVSQLSQIKTTSNKNLYKPTSVKKSFYYSQGVKSKIEVFLWEDVHAGAMLSGPSMIVSQNSTTVIDKGWNLLLDENNNAIITANKEIKKKNAYSEEALLELFSNRFTSVAQEMGAMLQRTSFSVNVKERLDFSCAVLDAQGYLVVNAPHIPVHLGSMGVCVREVKKVIEMTEGDVVITNHPAFGGSHLPDVTLIKPVFYKKKLVGYVANRAHHAEIGGKKPGSMPADATTLEEEGVIISPTYLVKKNKAQWKEVSSIFTSAKYPTRLLEENLADLNGALASVNMGEKGLQELCKKYGDEEVSQYMKQLKKYASGLLGEKLKSTTKKSFSAEEYLDDGSKLKVKFTIDKLKLILNFTGSSKVHSGNLNATKAIVQSVVLYVLRLWVNKPIAMNEGLMERVKLVLPNGLLDPFSNSSVTSQTQLPAVVGGNTEVSQRLTDTLLKALSLAACSQGTMNNFLFGNDQFGYYETIGGGTGSGNGFAGTDAVHSHMTNTRITDPEILELRYPVHLEKFEIRKNSGGRGKWKGGDGIVREIIFKENMEINILSQHRKEKPYGLKGGDAGKAGEHILINHSGKKIKLSGMDSASVKKGDKIIIKTPGGGAWGKKVDTTKRPSR